MVYNGFQIVFNAKMVVGLATPLWIDSPAPNIFGFHTNYQSEIEYWLWIHYLSKMVDWMDTMFMMVRGKYEQVTFLHVFHHSTIQLVWGYLLSDGHANGTAAFGAILNSFVHVVMYTHYLITSLNWKNPFKRYVTVIQIGQFYVCLLHAMIVATGWETIFPTRLASLQVTYMLCMLFTKMYHKQH